MTFGKKYAMALSVVTCLKVAGSMQAVFADDTHNLPTATSQPAAGSDEATIPAVITGGHDTDPRDRGRPVILVAAALDVPADVFRQAFKKVKPAHAGERPDPAQVRLNKQTLLHDLEPYGVTNDLLDTVSNYYRYVRSRGEMWRTSPAKAVATIDHGRVTAIAITASGSGYTSPPKISIPDAPNLNCTAVLHFDKDLSKNGSIEKITISNASTTSP